MNSSVQKLFERLENASESDQSKALAQLAMLWDKNGTRQQEDLWEIILTDGLMSARLPQEEVRELMDMSIAILKRRLLCRNAHLSLMGIIIRNAAADDMDQMFSFFSEIATNPDEDLFGVLAEFSQFLVKMKGTGRLQQLAERFDTVKALEAIQQTGSKRLKESALRTISFLRKP